ncbi:MAG: hypothetical protein M3464_03325 [Chloroflexota bacterium]|nr:hypothetical protein [Chloroflexota bacterium]
MPTRALSRRVMKITGVITPAVDPSVRAFASAVIHFGGYEPTPAAVEQLAHW